MVLDDDDDDDNDNDDNRVMIYSATDFLFSSESASIEIVSGCGN